MILFLLLTIAPLATASEIVQTVDGRKIFLKDDGQFEVLVDQPIVKEIKPEQVELSEIQKGAKGLKGHLVKVFGKMAVFEGSAVMRDISFPPNDVSVRIDLTYLNESSKKYLKLVCLLPCIISVVGKVGNVTGGIGVIATEIERL
jgi:hypothetical protein